MRHATALALLAATAALAGCTTPYSEVYGTRYFRAPIDTYPVIVVSVDGEHWLREPVLIDPGRREITVQAPPTVSQRYGSQRTVTLDIKPCTRYYLVAVKDNRLSSDFTVRVDYEEAIAGCTVQAG